MRSADIERNTKETQIKLHLDLDQKGKQDKLETGHGFFNHMLDSFSKHSRFNLEVKAQGDDTGPHHLVEDVGIVLGEALLEAAGAKRGIERFGHASIPMDETLMDVSIDFCGRGFMFFDLPDEITDTETGLGIHLIHDFFYALSFNGRFNLHMTLMRGKNPHHIIEAMFKGTAVALRKALEITQDDLPSTKGVL